MKEDIYRELKEELNKEDLSVGLYGLNLENVGEIEEVLESYNYKPLGKYTKRNSVGYKFSDGESMYVITEVGEELDIHRLME